MTNEEWVKFADSLHILKHPSLPILKQPTLATIRKAEKSLGVSLPLNYRRFISALGAGELAYKYRILAPGYPPSTQYDLLQYNQDLRERLDGDFLQFYEDPDRILRLVFFAVSGDGDLFGWDPLDLRDVRQHEYGIYKLGQQEVFEEVAASFPLFVTEVCLSEMNLHPPGWDDAIHGSRRIFEPVYDISGG